VTDAVLKPSDPLPQGTTQVEGIDFNRYADRNITAEELVANMANMGFQATSVAEAVRIINGMVCYMRSLLFVNTWAKYAVREHGETRRPHRAQPSFSAILPI